MVSVPGTRANRKTDLVGGEGVEGMVSTRGVQVGRFGGIGLVDDCRGSGQCGWGHIVETEVDRPLDSGSLTLLFIGWDRT